MYCSEFHQWLIHFNTTHGGLYWWHTRWPPSGPPFCIWYPSIPPNIRLKRTICVTWEDVSLRNRTSRVTKKNIKKILIVFFFPSPSTLTVVTLSNKESIFSLVETFILLFIKVTSSCLLPVSCMVSFSSFTSCVVVRFYWHSKNNLMDLHSSP